MSEIYEQLKKVGEAFRIPGALYSIDRVTNGNINSTYRVTYEENGTFHGYILQKINTLVFHNPKEVMANIGLVTSFIEKHFPQDKTEHFYETATGENYLFAEDHSFYRIMDFIDSDTFNMTEDPVIIRSTGKGFGRFQVQLAGLDGSRLFETIPDFHNTKKRYEALWDAASRDPRGRRAEVQNELDYLKSVEEKACDLSIRFAKGEFPVRVTHNDTKCNNILFDKKTKEPLAVIDLDTVMPGMAMYDFGDGVRFIANTAAEDEPETGKVALSLEKYEAFTEGFLSEVKLSLTGAEIQALPLGAFSATAELAVRFLTDYLEGDTYFKTLYPLHNLVRTRAQIALAQDMEKKWTAMNEIIAKYAED